MTDDVYDEACGALVAAVEAEVEPWMARRMMELAPDQPALAAEVAAQVRAEVLDQLGGLFEADIDAQRVTPLQSVRNATDARRLFCRDAGVSAVHRDPWQKESDPDDVYDLSPATWADVGPASAEAGLVWGAAKAMRHLARHRPAD